MDAHSFLIKAMVFLTAAVISVPLAKRLGLGSVLGYLLAGVLIGPEALALIGSEKEDILHFSEFGVVIMLFLIGLELEPQKLWRLRGAVFGLGGAQVGGTLILITAFASLWMGLDVKPALAVGMMFALSSTAIVLQSLQEKGLIKQSGGRRAFSILLFQDLAVIPMISILPLLSLATPTHNSDHSSPWLQALWILSAVTGIWLGGRYVAKPLFRTIAETRLREIFSAAALAIVVGIALLMQSIGLSPALGTFLAGVVLANSEYRHELETVIEPFKGLLLGMFFISVGANIDFGLILSDPWPIWQWLLGIIALKFLVLWTLGKALKLHSSESLLIAFFLAQGGEFAFVLLGFATQNQVLAPELAGQLTAVVALSMALTPLFMLTFERLIAPRFHPPKPTAPEPEDMPQSQVIVAGYGRFGQIVSRLLRANKIPTTLLDHSPRQIEMVSRFGIKVFYGDCARLDLLEAAGIAEAKLLILAIDDVETSLKVVDVVKASFPQVAILARARDRTHAFDLMERGVTHIFRETFGSALDMGVQALSQLGFRAYAARRRGELFRQHDEQSLLELFSHVGEEARYRQEARRKVADIERILEEDEEDQGMATDQAWDGPPKRPLPS